MCSALIIKGGDFQICAGLFLKAVFCFFYASFNTVQAS